METITDNDLKMFQERARTEFASGCDTGGIAWDSVIWDLCNEVRKLRSASRELGDAAKLREALKQVNELNDLWFDTFTLPDGATSIHDEIEDVISAALSAPPRNCDRFADETDAQIEFLNEVWLISVTKETALERDRFENWTDEMRSRYAKWLLAPATEKEGGNNG